MRTRPVSVAAVALSSLICLFAQPQEKLAPLTERIEVSLINVDVMVTDRAGHPISGLKAGDFEIFEDGKPQVVTNFYTIENAAVRAARGDAPEGVSDAQAQHFRRKAVLLVDNNFIQKPQRNAALDRFQSFIDNHFAGDYEWSVIVVGHGVHIIQPFTDDKDAVRGAIETVRAQGTYDEQHDTDRGLLSDPGRNGLRGDAPDEGGYDFGETMRFKGREQTMRNLRATTDSARAVIQTCRAFSASDGKKLMVLITGGMESSTSFAAFDSASDRELHDMKLQIGQVLDATVREANAANFNLYVINAKARGMQVMQQDVENKSSGIVTTAPNSLQQGGGNEAVDVSDVDSSSLTLTEGTGALYLPGRDIAASFERIDSDTSNFYSLAYSPRHPDDGAYHHISVRVKHPGAVARNRAGYVALTTDQRLEQSLRSPLSYSKEKGTLPVKLDLGVPDRGTTSLPLIAAMPMSGVTIIQRDDRYVGRVHVYLSIYDDHGTNVTFDHHVQEVSLTKAEFDQVGIANFRYRMKVALKKGGYTLVVTLRDELSNEIGSAFQDVRI